MRNIDARQDALLLVTSLWQKEKCVAQQRETPNQIEAQATSGHTIIRGAAPVLYVYCTSPRNYAYSIRMEIVWDPDKAASNIRKHGVSFEEVASALLDPIALAYEDKDSEAEARWVLIGMNEDARLLTVVYTLRNEETVLLISARKSSRKENKYYA